MPEKHELTVNDVMIPRVVVDILAEKIRERLKEHEKVKTQETS